MTTFLSRAAAKLWTTCVTPLGAARISGRMQTRFSHDSSNPLGEHSVTFHATKISDCFRQARAFVLGGKDVRALHDASRMLQLVDPHPGESQSGDPILIDCLYRLDGITLKMLQQSRQSILQIDFTGLNRAVINEMSTARRMQNASLLKSWSSIRAVIMEVNPKLTGIPDANASLRDIRTWMYANKSVLQGITNLSLNGLGLTCVPTEIELFTGLRGLFLSGNQLTSVSPRLCLGMGKLQRLHLDENQLTTLPQGLFYGLTELQSVKLSDNCLSSLPPGLFKDQRELHTLVLARNRLSSLPKGTFEGLDKLDTLILFGNPRLLASFQDFSCWSNHIAFPKLMEDFFGYSCESPFAKLYQLAAGDSSLEAVKESFSKMDEGTQKAICRIVCVAAGHPDNNNPRWEMQHIFEDRHMFHGALKRHVRESYERLPNGQKNAVLDCVYGVKPGGRGELELDLNFGHGSRLNILKLIDAMSNVPHGPNGISKL